MEDRSGRRGFARRDGSPHRLVEEVQRHRPVAEALRVEPAEVEAGPELRLRVPGLKGSIGEGPNHSNFSNQSSVKILSK